MCYLLVNFLSLTKKILTRTLGDNMRPMAYDMNNQGKPAGPSPASGDAASSDAADSNTV